VGPHDYNLFAIMSNWSREGLRKKMRIIFSLQQEEDGKCHKSGVHA
jgi:hypothetical protein